MRCVSLAIFLLCWAAKLLAAPVAPQESTDGEALADRLRSARPEENSRIHGTLIIHSGDDHKEIPIVCQVTLNSSNWQTSYETTATAQNGAERLVVIHTTNGPNQYLYARGASPLKSIPAAEALMPLAGSDFSLADLGLEFLHWPAQRQFKGEMRLGQPCFVLESGNPGANEIVRVKSDIDKETGGLLIADAYDAGGRLVKEFSLHGSSFKKVNGQWRLEKMEIRNKKTHSQTEMKFDLSQ